MKTGSIAIASIANRNVYRDLSSPVNDDHRDVTVYRTNCAKYELFLVILPSQYDRRNHYYTLVLCPNMSVGWISNDLLEEVINDQTW